MREQQQRAERPQSRGPNPTAVPPEHSGKFTIHAAPQNPSTVASLPPPPVLSAAQQGHLHQILRERDLHERERLERQVHERAASGAAGGRGSELQRRYAQIQHGGASAEREGRYRLSSPSLQQFQVGGMACRGEAAGHILRRYSAVDDVHLGTVGFSFTFANSLG